MPKATPQKPSAENEPAVETPAPPRERLRPIACGKTLLGQVVVLTRKDPIAGKLLEAIVDRFMNEDSGLSFEEACWQVIAKDGDLDFSFQHLKTHARSVSPLLEQMVRGTWFGMSFLGFCCEAIRTWGRELMPEDILNSVDDDHDQFMMQMDAARRMLRDLPQYLINDIRRAVKAHPELAE